MPEDWSLKLCSQGKCGICMGHSLTWECRSKCPLGIMVRSALPWSSWLLSLQAFCICFWYRNGQPWNYLQIFSCVQADMVQHKAHMQSCPLPRCHPWELILYITPSIEHKKDLSLLLMASSLSSLTIFVNSIFACCSEEHLQIWTKCFRVKVCLLSLKPKNLWISTACVQETS